VDISKNKTLKEVETISLFLFSLLTVASASLLLSDFQCLLCCSSKLPGPITRRMSSFLDVI